MAQSFRIMYDSLTPSLRKSDEPPPLPLRPPPPLPSRSLPLLLDIPPPPPLLPSCSLPLLSALAPSVPPPFAPSPIPPPLPPVFAPDSEVDSLKQKLNELESKFALWSKKATPRRQRAYTEGGRLPPRPDYHLLYAKLLRLQSKKQQVVQSIAQLEKYISQQTPHERDFDFNLDKCLDNAARKLKKKRKVLKEAGAQIAALEEQLSRDNVFPLRRPSVPASSSYRTSLPKKKNYMARLTTRAKSWPFS